MPRIIDKAYMRDKSGNVHTGQALWLALTLHLKKSTNRKRPKRV